MLHTRRQFLTSVSTILAVFAAARAYAAPPGFDLEVPYPVPDGERIPSLDELKVILERHPTFGVDPADGDKIDMAIEIMKGAPTNTTPLKVAEYFLGLEQGDSSDYLEEWVRDANPLILGFFKGTEAVPDQGDCTHWCTAFVSWCVMQARIGRKDAAECVSLPRTCRARNYRDWATKTEHPQRGDVAVFWNFDARGRPLGTGHTAFYLPEQGGGENARIKILGGNQSYVAIPNSNCPDKGDAGGRISVDYHYDNPEQRLHSFRTDRCLHDPPR
jgi:hypothetical protein